MENRHHRSLELDKILEKLAEKTACEDSRQLALNIQPEVTLEKAQALLQWIFPFMMKRPGTT